MQVISCQWAVDHSLLAQDLVMALIAVGESLNTRCTALLEGKEEEERSYLGFGKGWIIAGNCEDGELGEPFEQLRAFMKHMGGEMKVLKHSNKSLKEQGSARHSDADPVNCKSHLESGLIGYLDYEWGLYWQKPASMKYRPRFFFRLCPVNVVILPQTRQVVLEIFAETAEQAGDLLEKWEEGITSALTDLAKKPAKDPARDLASVEYLLNDSASHVFSNATVTELSPPQDLSSGEGWMPNMTKEQFLAKVEALKEQIRAGEIFQAVFSQKFSRRLTLDPWDVYRRLRQVNPSPYLFYVEGQGETLVGSSPELLVSTKGRRVSTCPIAGTRPRGKTPEQDRLHEQELLADIKENAEHAMLVDLGRNDIGRVARYGTVMVKHYAEVVRYSHVMHLVSRVEGELAPEFDGLDALKALFPAGTLSGAPKVRAMELIQELEPEKRGYYGGSLGVVRWNGDIDFCITIRTLRISGDEVSVQAGAGIVYDSLPLKEYEETLHKAQALMKVVNECADGNR